MDWLNCTSLFQPHHVFSFLTPEPCSTMTERRILVSRVKDWTSTSATSCTCWTLQTMSGGRHATSVQMERWKRSESFPARGGSAALSFHMNTSYVLLLCGEWWLHSGWQQKYPVMSLCESSLQSQLTLSSAISSAEFVRAQAQNMPCNACNILLYFIYLVCSIISAVHIIHYVCPCLYAKEQVCMYYNRNTWEFN